MIESEENNMKRILPNDIYRDLPCSVVAVGCAKGITIRSEAKKLLSDELKQNGYLSLNGMNTLVRANCDVIKTEQYKRSERPELREFAHQNEGKKAVICVLGHYVYFDGHNYHSFFFNGGDQVVKVWYLKE